jgi:hypothetical protein
MKDFRDTCCGQPTEWGRYLCVNGSYQIRQHCAKCGWLSYQSAPHGPGDGQLAWLKPRRIDNVTGDLFE